MKSLSFFFFVYVNFCFAQNNFKGQLLDAASKRPIPFGHFSYENHKGFILDEQGNFTTESKLQEIRVKISAIGYKNKTVNLSAINKNKIYLTPKTEHLNEVILDFEDPVKSIIKKVVRNIPLNYPTQQEQVYCHYRQNTYYDSLHNSTMYKAEAYLKADKFSYAKKSASGNVQLLDHKIDVIDMDSIEIMFYGGIHSVHSNDYVLKRAGPLNINHLNNYKLTIKDTL
ncbi:MAG: hypothetical protein ACPGC8_04175 [Flavobacteriaceae bacterium]